MCGYSTTWKPRSNAAPPVCATAFTLNWPGATDPVGASVKRNVWASSARSKRTCADAGVTDHPWGASRSTSASTGFGALFVTTTRISRVAAAAPALLVRCGPEAVGTIRMSGVDRTDSAGTTFSSIRFSPLKMLPSYRYWTGNETWTGTSPIVNVSSVTNGVGLKGSPNAASASNV